MKLRFYWNPGTIPQMDEADEITHYEIKWWRYTIKSRAAQMVTMPVTIGHRWNKKWITVKENSLKKDDGQYYYELPHVKSGKYGFKVRAVSKKGKKGDWSGKGIIRRIRKGKSALARPLNVYAKTNGVNMEIYFDQSKGADMYQVYRRPSGLLKLNYLTKQKVGKGIFSRNETTSGPVTDKNVFEGRSLKEKVNNAFLPPKAYIYYVRAIGRDKQTRMKIYSDWAYCYNDDATQPIMREVYVVDQNKNVLVEHWLSNNENHEIIVRGEYLNKIEEVTLYRLSGKGMVDTLQRWGERGARRFWNKMLTDGSTFWRQKDTISLGAPTSTNKEWFKVDANAGLQPGAYVVGGRVGNIKAISSAVIQIKDYQKIFNVDQVNIKPNVLLSGIPSQVVYVDGTQMRLLLRGRGILNSTVGALVGGGVMAGATIQPFATAIIGLIGIIGTTVSSPAAIGIAAGMVGGAVIPAFFNKNMTSRKIHDALVQARTNQANVLPIPRTIIGNDKRNFYLGKNTIRKQILGSSVHPHIKRVVIDSDYILNPLLFEVRDVDNSPGKEGEKSEHVQVVFATYRVPDKLKPGTLLKHDGLYLIFGVSPEIGTVKKEVDLFVYTTRERRRYKIGRFTVKAAGNVHGRIEVYPSTRFGTNGGGASNVPVLISPLQ
jgi:hypothetical protein